MLAYPGNVAPICQQHCWQLPTTLLAYSSTPTNLIPQTNKYVIYKHKICLFRTYNLQRRNRISYCSAGSRILDIPQKRKRLRHFLVKKFGYIAHFIAADATSVEDLEKVFTEAQEKLGGKIDFVLHSVAMSPNVRKHRTYDDLDYNFLNKTLDISAISFHKMLQVAKKLDAINEWGSVVALTYVASQRTFFGYNDMADAKSMLESIARSFGYIYGREKHVRINTISQSPTATTAGKGIKDIENMMDFADKMSPLGNAVAEDCANYCVMMFSDFTRKVTMQNLFHDGGFSSMGMSLRAMNQYAKDLAPYEDENGKVIYG